MIVMRFYLKIKMLEINKGLALHMLIGQLEFIELLCIRIR